MAALIPLRTYVAAAVFVLMAAAIGVQTVRLTDERSAHQTTKAEFAKDIAEAEKAAREAVSAARREEGRRYAAMQEIVNEHTKERDRATRDAAAATASGQRLRQRIAELSGACRVSAEHSAAAASGEAAGAGVDLLADVQRRLDEAADAIARHADESAAAGHACERAYDALSPRD